ncbi:MAG: hypothetical protein K2X95_07270 [Flavobacteriaceae bacterium]|nr:hypothetical protein [Flavobacteriaceae bacterium]
MSKVNLFILIPENNPKFSWINSIDILIEENNIRDYLRNLDSYKKSINYEKYDGYYDKNSLIALSNQIKILEDSYPRPTLRILQSIFEDFFDWRENPIHSDENNKYTIFAIKIENHTFCEVAQRKHNNFDQAFAFINYRAITIQNEIAIKINNINNHIEILENEIQLINWFSENRIPKRNFQSIPKHRISDPIQRNGETISPLYGNAENAEIILKTAIGINSKELFGYDESNEMVIVFKFENDTPQNQYHGYHIAKNSEEIPKEIRAKLFNN